MTLVLAFLYIYPQLSPIESIECQMSTHVYPAKRTATTPLTPLKDKSSKKKTIKALLQKLLLKIHPK